MSSWLHVCPVRGATLLCGEGGIYALRDGAMVRDVTLEAGLPHDPGGTLTALVDVHGRWPGNAWLVATRVSEPPPFQVTVYRWSGDRWTLAIPERRSMHEIAAIVPWGASGAALIRGTPGPEVYELLGIGARAGRSLRTFEAVAAFDEDVLVVATRGRGSNDPDALRLWTSSSAAPAAQGTPLTDGDGGVAVDFRGIVHVGARDVVIYGSRMSPHGKTAYLARFDGHSLTTLTAPPSADVTSYAEEPSGTGWALSAGNDVPWRREPAGAWRPVPLPLRCTPSGLALTDDGSVWVRAYGPLVGDAIRRQIGTDAALFSTMSPTHVLQIGEDWPAR
jgi:hypothetical protein